MTKSRQEATGRDSADFRAIPRFQRIGEDLRTRIRSGEWAVGAQIPGRQVLSGDYEVDIHTLERAIAPLLQEGILHAEPRRGTFVAQIPTETRFSPAAGASAPSVSADRPQIPLAGKTTTVGIIGSIPVDSSGDGWVPFVFRELERTLARHGATSCWIEGGVTGPGDRIDIAAKHPGEVGAVVAIMVNEPESDVDAFLRSAVSAPFPVVAITSTEFPYPATHVFTDQRAGGYLAASHLLRAGYSRILFLAPYRNERWIVDRVAGAALALREGRSHPAADVVFPHEEEGVPYAAWTKLSLSDRLALLQKHADASLRLMEWSRYRPGECALIVPSDWEGILLIRVLKEMGISAGRDVGVVSFDDHPETAQLGLSSVRPPLTDLSESAARLLLHGLSGCSMPIQTRLAGSLIFRLSSKPH